MFFEKGSDISYMMLYYDRIDVFEVTDVNKKRALKESIICHY